MTHLILIRHGETDWNRVHRFQGTTDIPLNDTGRQQADALAPRLRPLTLDAIYSSDLCRVTETAERALMDRAQRLQRDATLRELGFGFFEGLTYEQIKARYPDELATWEADRTQPVHGGDALPDVIQRLQRFTATLRERHPEQNVLLFGHGGTLAILLALALGMDPLKWWQLRMDNAAMTRLSLYRAGSILTLFNDTCHLKDLA